MVQGDTIWAMSGAVPLLISRTSSSFVWVKVVGISRMEMFGFFSSNRRTSSLRIISPRGVSPIQERKEREIFFCVMKVPLPCFLESTPSATRRLIACRMVETLVPNIFARVCSLGIALPGSCFPSTIFFWS